MPNNRVKVLYIAGPGRSGSTVLGNVLGEIEGFFHGGELNFIWEHNLIENRLCSCGAPARAAPRDGPAAVFRHPHPSRTADALPAGEMGFILPPRKVHGLSGEAVPGDAGEH